MRANDNAGLIVLPHALTNANRDLIVALTLRYRSPSINGFVGSVNDGSLINYSNDYDDSFQRTAEYVDRISHGEKPADLPVQQPTKFKLAFNLRTARVIGLVSVRKVNKAISLAFLAPNLVEAAIDGRLPHGMGVARLSDLPVEWSEQYRLLRSVDAVWGINPS